MKIEELKEIEIEVNNCEKCRLCGNRLNAVFGEGNIDADIMFTGESPGKEESEQGRPFVGRSGKLLNAWIIKELGLTRKDVYIANIIKCRPPSNRNPQPDEVELCLPYLNKQIEIIKPKIIILLGAVALKSLFQNNNLGIMKCRGKWLSYNDIPVMPTYHPAFLLRQMSEKNKNAVKNDFKLILEKIS